MILEKDSVASHTNELYVDCTARALESNVNNRSAVFAPGLIRLQMIRQFQPTFSAALIGHIEATIADETEKQKLTQVAAMTDTVEDWLKTMALATLNQGNWSSNKELFDWITNCRLDLYTRQFRSVRPDDTAKQATIAKLREFSGPAARNLFKLAQECTASVR
jgi:hypothetical protein